MTHRQGPCTHSSAGTAREAFRGPKKLQKNALMRARANAPPTYHGAKRRTHVHKTTAGPGTAGSRGRGVAEREDCREREGPARNSARTCTKQWQDLEQQVHGPTAEREGSGVDGLLAGERDRDGVGPPARLQPSNVFFANEKKSRIDFGLFSLNFHAGSESLPRIPCIDVVL